MICYVFLIIIISQYRSLFLYVQKSNCSVVNRFIANHFIVNRDPHSKTRVGTKKLKTEKSKLKNQNK